MRLFPAFLADHPVEALVAVVLLLGVLFGSADRHAAELAAMAKPGAPAAARM